MSAAAAGISTSRVSNANGGLPMLQEFDLAAGTVERRAGAE